MTAAKESYGRTKSMCFDDYGQTDGYPSTTGEYPDTEGEVTTTTFGTEDTGSIGDEEDWGYESGGSSEGSSGSYDDGGDGGSWTTGGSGGGGWPGHWLCTVSPNGNREGALLLLALGALGLRRRRAAHSCPDR